MSGVVGAAKCVVVIWDNCDECTLFRPVVERDVVVKGRATVSYGGALVEGSPANHRRRLCLVCAETHDEEAQRAADYIAGGKR